MIKIAETIGGRTVQSHGRNDRFRRQRGSAGGTAGTVSTPDLDRRVWQVERTRMRGDEPAYDVDSRGEMLTSL
jgi:hypothetical protein